MFWTGKRCGFLTPGDSPGFMNLRACARGWNTILSHRSQRLGRVLRFQAFIIRVGEFPGRAIELDLFQRPQRDGLRAQIVVGVFALIAGGRYVHRGRRPQDGEEYEIGRRRCEHDAGDQLEQFQRSAGQPVELLTQPLELGGRRVRRRDVVRCWSSRARGACPAP